MFASWQEYNKCMKLSWVATVAAGFLSYMSFHFALSRKH